MEEAEGNSFTKETRSSGKVSKVLFCVASLALRASLRRKEMGFIKCIFRHDYAALAPFGCVGQNHKPPQEAKVGLAWGPR